MILVPAALAISALAPWAVTPLLMLGGAFLCFEGFEKLAHKFLPHDAAEPSELAPVSEPDSDTEQDKIKGAIRTDFILSAEIIAITLGTVADAALQQQIIVLSGIALIMTVGVYGAVAAIVKLDDGGLYLLRNSSSVSNTSDETLGSRWWRQVQQSLGRGILRTAPYLMKSLTVIGTVAMFMVGGGILTHGISAVHHGIAAISASLASLPVAGKLLELLAPTLLDALFGVVAGAVVLLLVEASQRIWKKLRGAEVKVK